ncbi:MAG: GIN domain-containing protein [Bacteroidia bacterium]
MKTSIKNLISAVLTTVVITSSAFASADEQNSSNTVTILKQVKNINKLVVSGNVEVYLIQAPVESVKVYDSYYSKNALVQQEEGVLRISSFQKETLKVAVYVNNISTIQASDNASVRTFGKVSFLSLDILLKDKATATIESNTVNLYTSVKDNASLTLSGSTEDHNAVLGSAAQMSMNHFTASNSSVASILPQVIAAKKPAKDTVESLSQLNFSEIGK